MGVGDPGFFWANKQLADAHARVGAPPPTDDPGNPYAELLDDPADLEPAEPPPRWHDLLVTSGASLFGPDCGMHYPINNPRWQADRVARLKRGSRR